MKRLGVALWMKKLKQTWNGLRTAYNGEKNEIKFNGALPQLSYLSKNHFHHFTVQMREVFPTKALLIQQYSHMTQAI